MSSRILAISALAAFVLLGSCQSGRQVMKDRVIISADDSKLVFYLDDPSGLTPTFYREGTTNYAAVLYTGVWRNPGGQFPFALIRYTELAPSFHFEEELDIGKYVDELKFGGLTPVKSPEKGLINNTLGPIDYRGFSLGPNQCVAFSQTWGQATHDGTSAGTNRVFGHYCAAPGESLPDKRIADIVMAVGVKGHGVPEQPAGWRTAKAGSSTGNLVELLFEARWVGFNEQLQGKMFIDLGKRNKGRMWLGLPGKSGECTGEWIYESGKFETPVLPTGTWSVICTNGLSAEGTYVNSEPKKGYGEGKDGDGNPIIFTYGS